MKKKLEQLIPKARTFAGQTLQPLTKQREVTACQMGLQFGFVARYKAQYFLRDTIIVLWLCSIPVAAEKGWTVDRAETDTEGAIREAYAWAAKVGIGIDTPAFSEGYKLFTEMMREVQAQRGEPIIPKNKTREPDTGEL